jgi:uncharacterized protein (TIGR00255 family)
MIRSMTGQGIATSQADGAVVTAEVRSVNHRYLKVSTRFPDGFAGLEASVEQVIREKVRRGSMHVNLQISQQEGVESNQIQESVLANYVTQIQRVAANLGLDQQIQIETLLALPGVIQDAVEEEGKLEKIQPLIEQAIRGAVAQLDEMRIQEGGAMGEDLKQRCDAIEQSLGRIAERAPQLAQLYQNRLWDRINALLSDKNLEVAPADIAKEVGVFAERADISEEIVRLRSHLEQFRKLVAETVVEGRKLEFLTQEMFRETNTIGSKANDAGVARDVIEIKAEIERMREMIQNVE